MNNPSNIYLLLIFWAIVLLPLFVKGQFNTLGVSAASGYDITLHSSPGTPLKAVLPIDSIQTAEKEKREMSRIYAPLKSLHITSGAGWRMHPITRKLTLHRGIDLRADFEPVYAVMDGMVEKAGYDQPSGFYIRLIHSRFMTTSYAHLSVIKVKEGAIIKAGEIIGISGNSGTSTGPHLHFRIDYTNTRSKNNQIDQEKKSQQYNWANATSVLIVKKIIEIEISKNPSVFFFQIIIYGKSF